jgi:uncharacterized protein
MAPLRAGRTLVVVLVVLVPLLAAATPVPANYQAVREWTEEVSSRSVTMLVPAVGEAPDGRLFGVTMELEATVRDGSGGVYVDTRPLTQLDMQGSARLAAATAAGISATPFDSYDYFIKVRSPAPAVGGPSAGAAMTVAFTALLLELPVRADVMMTGMVNPDGSIGPIGGILQKAEAADQAGATLFLIPEGQRLVRDVVQTIVEENGVSRVVTEERLIDVVEHARVEWRLTVREVGDMYDAVEAATEHAVARPEPPVASRSPVFDEVMGEAASAHLERAEEKLATTRTALNESGLARSQPDVSAQLDELLALGERRLEQARTAFDAGSPYTASSRAFQAGVEITRAMIWVEALDSGDAAAFVASRLDMAQGRVEEARERAAAAQPRSVSTLEATGAAQVRAMEAAGLLARTAAFLEQGRVGEAVQSLAFAEERAESVAWWLDMAAALAARVEDARIETDVRALAREYRTYAREALTYAEVLGAQTAAGGVHGQLLERSRAFLDDAQAAAQENLVLGSFYLAVEAQVAAHAALSLLGSEALIDDRLERQARNALIAVEGARMAGVEPFLAASFQQFAPALEEQDAISALLMYGNAASIATLSRALATGEACPFAVVLCAADAPAVQRVAFGGPDPWTAYFALATIIFGFMAGVLVTLVVQRRRIQERVTPGVPSTPLHAVPASTRRGVALAPGGPAEGNGHGRHLVRLERARPVAASPVIVPVRRPVRRAGATRRNYPDRP